ncbi:MAG: AAA family ATPase [Candidatus Poribacteria bacterium]|nr:AAA family ATPase [Candidatus Poribacteria bacterium]
MKICKLKLKGLNSFRGEVEIDFEKSPLDDASLVAITGPTGSGKTTLLDAMCVALYGKTPRLSGTTNQHPRHLISHGETEGFAEVYFEANSTRYHATWSIKRKGSPKGQLFDDSDELITTKVAQEVESILGLDFDAFRRSVMLAQGEFAAFLKATDEKRRTILEATAGISIYDVLKKVLNDKVSKVEAANAEVYDKLNKIPEASREQLIDAEVELDRLQKEAKQLGEEIQQAKKEKARETKRTEDFEKLQSSEKRQDELLAQQAEIDAVRVELENANLAQRLLPEKQAFDTTKSELEKATAALSSAETEKMEAVEQAKTDQAVFDEKAKMYQDASTERDRRVEIYTEAKSDVEWAEDRFTAAEKRTPDLADLGKQIDTLESELTQKQTEKIQLQERIDEAQTFLHANRLPTNSPQRLNDATGLLAELTAHQKQLETASASKLQQEKKVSSLKRKIEKLSETCEERLAEKTETEAALENAKNDLNKLLATGTDKKWAARKQQAAKAQPIAQKYEAAKNDLADTENQLNDLNETVETLNAELEQIEADLANQTEVCQQANEVVQRCETERESLLLANPINQLRQRLHAGEPCRVCGAMEHPYADVVEDENENLLQDAEAALADAKTDAQTAQDQMQALTTKQTQTKQNRHNNSEQIKNCDTEIEELRSEMAQLLTEWQKIYPDTDVSPDWATERINEADTAIADLVEAKQTHTQASHDYQTALQQLGVCENNIANEKKVLSETDKQLKEVSDDVKDLEADIKSIKTRFWEFLPDTFHGVTPKEAKDQFQDKIETVEVRNDERDTSEAQLQVLNIKIESGQSSLESLRKSHKELQAEIDEYQREAETLLNAVREKTGGLEIGTEINEAIDKLEAELQAKETESDQAAQRLQDSRSLFTQKETAYEICKNQREESDQKFEAARQTYFDKLKDAGFDSPEAHDCAFRDDDQIQEFTDQIDAHAAEIQRLALEITELQTRFEETPFNPDALGQIETQLKEIEAQLQETQQEIGAQQQSIDNLKKALKEREELGIEVAEAETELARWKRLQETIPANDLRDFALEIMFKQMGSLANEQLKYLTSERYQLKVEGIGNLSVVDRWNANEERPVETLSGGESFLTSLALALALSELSRGRAQLNSLFLDEGFGTLDAETLDTAIGALEGLRMQGRNIFLISHIQELTRRLPVKINVRKRGNGSANSSSIDIRG